MEKILLKKIIWYQFCLFLAATLIFGGILWQIETNHVYHEMRQILDQEETYYLNTQVIIEEKVTHYTSDYMTKLYGVDYLLNKYPDMRSNICLQSLSTFFGVNKIYFFGNDGAVLYSNDDYAIGTRLLDKEDALPFANLLEHGGDVVLNFECNTIIAGGEGLNFIAMPSTLEGCSMVLMGIDKQLAIEFQDEIALQSLLLQIPTTNDNALYALSTETGKLLSKTIGNSLLDVTDNPEYDTAQLTELFQSSSHGKIIKIQGIPTFLMTRVVDNVLFLDVRLATTQLKKIGWIFLGLLVLNLAIVCLTHSIIKQYFHQYVFSEIDTIQQTITQLINGNEAVDFHTSRETELSTITTALNAWNQTIRYTQKKLNWIINITNPNAAMFECLAYPNVVYYSNNFQTVCNIEQAQWDAIKENMEQFKAYFNNLEQKKNQNGIVAIGDKFLLLQLYQLENDYFGILVDKTASVKRKEQQAIDLRKALTDSETDSLTGLLNRRGFETQVKKQLADGTKSAVMLILDIDNFKKVNDVLGHPKGDVLLQQVGNCLKQQFRESDLLARLGGDEFTVFLSDVTDAALHKKLTNLIDALRNALSEYDAYHTTMSIGAARTNGKKTEYSILYEQADKALCTAKRTGKNHYEFFER